VFAEHLNRFMGLANVPPEFGCTDNKENFLRIAFFYHAVVVEVRESFNLEKESVEVAKVRRVGPDSAHRANECPEFGNNHGQPRIVLVTAR
jgi:hypothetical protein